MSSNRWRQHQHQARTFDFANPACVCCVNLHAFTPIPQCHAGDRAIPRTRTAHPSSRGRTAPVNTTQPRVRRASSYELLHYHLVQIYTAAELAAAASREPAGQRRVRADERGRVAALEAQHVLLEGHGGRLRGQQPCAPLLRAALRGGRLLLAYLRARQRDAICKRARTRERASGAARELARGTITARAARVDAHALASSGAHRAAPAPWASSFVRRTGTGSLARAW